MRSIRYFEHSANCLSPCRVQFVQNKMPLSQCENSVNKLFNPIRVSNSMFYYYIYIVAANNITSIITCTSIWNDMPVLHLYNKVVWHTGCVS